MTWRSLIVVAAVALLTTGCASPPSVLGEGMYTVPDQIRPGIYHTSVTQGVGDAVCSWARYGWHMKRDAVASYGVGDQGRVVVLDDDEAVEFEGPCEWKRQEP